MAQVVVIEMNFERPTCRSCTWGFDFGLPRGPDVRVAACELTSTPNIDTSHSPDTSPILLSQLLISRKSVTYPRTAVISEFGIQSAFIHGVEKKRAR
jgi:hypothetical protein